MTKRFLVVVLAFFSTKNFSQIPVLENSKEGAYASFVAFENGRPVISIDSLETQIMRNLGGNLLVLPLSPYENMWAIVYKGFLFTRRSQNIKTSDLPLAILPLGGPLVTIKKSAAAFVRIMKYGKLCLSADNTLVKLPFRRDHELTVSKFKKLIKDDEVLLSQFLLEKDRKIMIYKYIDLYNERSNQRISDERSDSDN
jgi:hypothetical protein